MLKKDPLVSAVDIHELLLGLHGAAVAGVCSFEACFTRSCPVCKTALDLPSDCGEDDDEEEEEEELELEGVGGAAARRLKVEEDEEEQQQCGKARRPQQPGAGLMSRLYDVIPGWAFAQVGSALMFQVSRKGHALQAVKLDRIG